MKRWCRRATASGLMVLGLCSLVLPAAMADGVSADDAHNAFVIRAGAANPGSSRSGECAGCATVIAVPECINGIDFVGPQPGSGCLALDGSCPRGQRFVRQWRAGAGTWIQGDLSCVDLDGVPTLAQIGDIVRERVIRHVPEATITTEPPSHMLVRLPVLFDSGQPDGDLRWHDDVAGVPVATTVSATWRWSFDGDQILATEHAGSTWPDTSVSHMFTEPGRHQVELATAWTGSFQIAGLSSQPIAGAVSQTARRQLRLHAAGAVLQPALR